MTVTENKCQLIEIICEQLQEKGKSDINSAAHKLIVTGPSPVPNEVFQGTVTYRDDLETTHEEANVIIPQQNDGGSCNRRKKMHQGYL